MRLGVRVLGSVLLGLSAMAVAPVVAHADSGPPAATSNKVATDEHHVAVGFYGVTLQGLDVRDNSFYADFYFWMRWRGDADPTTTMEVTNNIDRWATTRAAVYDKPRVLPSGERIQIFRLQGRFFQPLNLSRYPLDRQSLTIKIEDTTRTVDDLSYAADRGDTGVDPGLVQPGWTVTGSHIDVRQHYYDTSFGEETTDKADRTYSQVVYSIDIARPHTFFFWKLFFPVVIVLLLGMSALFVEPTMTEFRVAAPPAALLALVFLQNTYSSTLPALGSLVLLDKIYVLAYAVVLISLVTTIISGTWAKSEKPLAQARGRHLDRIMAAITVGLFAAGVVAVLL